MGVHHIYDSGQLFVRLLSYPPGICLVQGLLGLL